MTTKTGVDPVVSLIQQRQAAYQAIEPAADASHEALDRLPGTIRRLALGNDPQIFPALIEKYNAAKEVADWRAAADAHQAALDRYHGLERQALLTPAQTRAGLVAQFELLADMLAMGSTIDEADAPAFCAAFRAGLDALGV